MNQCIDATSVHPIVVEVLEGVQPPLCSDLSNLVILVPSVAL